MEKESGVCREEAALAAPPLELGSSCPPWDTGRGLGALLTQGRGSKALPGRALHSMPTAGSSQAGPSDSNWPTLFWGKKQLPRATQGDGKGNSPAPS